MFAPLVRVVATIEYHELVEIVWRACGEASCPRFMQEVTISTRL